MSEEPKTETPASKPKSWKDLTALEQFAVSTVISESAARLEVRLKFWTLYIGVLFTALMWKAFSPQLYWVTTAFILLGVYTWVPKFVGHSYFFYRMRQAGFPLEDLDRKE